MDASLINTFFAFIWIVIKILFVVVPLVLLVAYMTYAERKIIGFMQNRMGPNRVGVIGLLQPFADVIKLIMKEIIIPTASNRYLFILAPLLSITPALAVWSVIPFGFDMTVTNIDASLLFVFALSSIGVYGILVSGWASNSKYALFGALRAGAQTVSYEIAMGFTFVGVLIAAGSSNLQQIVMHQQGGIWHWYWLPLFPLFIIYLISGVAETNRHPFDVSEGEAEIVAGFHVEYSGPAFAIFFLAEYANMILVSTLAALLFLGGWLSPFEGVPVLVSLFSGIPGIFWLMIKTSIFLFLYFWLRATFPRYRYDQIMRLGWKILIPLSLVWIAVISIGIFFRVQPWFS